MAKPPEIVEFDAAAADAVVAMMEGIAVTGKGWINFQPAVDPDDVPGSVLMQGHEISASARQKN